MTLDFTLKKYRELCQIIANSNYLLLTLEEYFSMNNKPEKFIILRHDIDDEPEYALKMAQLENEMNIKSTYYFRASENIFKQDIIREISSLGHEIGYHYEVMDEASGDYEKAIEIFKQNLEKFKELYNVKTIAQHGSPLLGKLNATSFSGLFSLLRNIILSEKIFSLHLNIDIWKKYDFNDFGIIGEAYISIDFQDICYFSDTGMSWNNRYRIKDIVDSTSYSSIRISKSDDIFAIIQNQKINKIYILIHPDQWRDNYPDWLKWQILKHLRIIGKIAIKKMRSKDN